MDKVKGELFKLIQVQFSPGYKSYDYLCTIENIHVDDYVLVPVGYNNTLKIAKVVKVYYAHEDELEHDITFYKCTDQKAETDTGKDEFQEIYDATVLTDEKTEATHYATTTYTNTDTRIEEPSFSENLGDKKGNKSCYDSKYQLWSLALFELSVAVITYCCMDTSHRVLGIFHALCIFIFGAYFYAEIAITVIYGIATLFEIVARCTVAWKLEKEINNNIWFAAILIAGWIAIVMYAMYHKDFLYATG